jgi:hypothetical protein
VVQCEIADVHENTADIVGRYHHVMPKVALSAERYLVAARKRKLRRQDADALLGYIDASR